MSPPPTPTPIPNPLLPQVSPGSNERPPASRRLRSFRTDGSVFHAYGGRGGPPAGRKYPESSVMSPCTVSRAFRGSAGAPSAVFTRQRLAGPEGVGRLRIGRGAPGTGAGGALRGGGGVGAPPAVPAGASWFRMRLLSSAWGFLGGRGREWLCVCVCVCVF